MIFFHVRSFCLPAVFKIPWTPECCGGITFFLVSVKENLYRSLYRFLQLVPCFIARLLNVHFWRRKSVLFKGRLRWNLFRLVMGRGRFKLNVYFILSLDSSFSMLFLHLCYGSTNLERNTLLNHFQSQLSGWLASWKWQPTSGSRAGSCRGLTWKCAGYTSVGCPVPTTSLWFRLHASCCRWTPVVLGPSVLALHKEVNYGASVSSALFPEAAAAQGGLHLWLSYLSFQECGDYLGAIDSIFTKSRAFQ